VGLLAVILLTCIQNETEGRSGNKRDLLRLSATPRSRGGLRIPFRETTGGRMVVVDGVVGAVV